ncbi:thioredoxin-like [Apostichopus japonicus]|uniref:thioredoxin-like n=1 Tax=Stichopus japonicus TaxID=307972 RepID=UPI003AB15378
MGVKQIANMAELDAALKEAGDKLVIVDFYAEWCGPCKRIAPDIKKLAEEHTDVVFLKVDVDEAEDVAAAKGIEAMPTFHFYKSGDKVVEFTGANLEQLKKHLDELK